MSYLHQTTVIIAFFLLNLGIGQAQSTLAKDDAKKLNQENLFTNPNADKALTGWKREGEASVNRKSKFFTVHDDQSSLWQSFDIPKGAKIFYLSASTKNKRERLTGHPYLLVEFLDATGRVVDKKDFGVQNKSTKWKTQEHKIKLTQNKKAVYIKVSLRKTANAENGLYSKGNAAHFDNLVGFYQ